MKRKVSSDACATSDDLKSKADSEGNSSDSLYEIRLNEFVRREEISDFDLRALVVRCSACGRQINHHHEKEIKKHRKLDVITCKECYEFYGSSEFSQDESGYNYCTWCGNGGKLIVCDYCPNGFCNPCVRRNFGRGEISETTKEGWKCYVCNKKRLKPKIKFCDLVLSFKDKSLLKKDKKQSPNAAIAEAWLQSAFEESETACKVFCKQMAKLRAIGIGKKKSLKHIVKKMEDVIKGHKTSLKNIVGTLNDSYSSYIEQQQAAELASGGGGDIEMVDISNDNENSVHASSDCIIVENNDTGTTEKQAENNDITAGKPPTPSSAEDKSKDKRIQSKLLLLQSSSDSDNNEKDNVDKVKDSESLEKNNANEDPLVADTPVKVPVKKDDKTKDRVSRKIDFTFSDMSNSDFDLDKPNLDELVKEVDEQFESDPNNPDPKLKLETRVELFRCDHLLKEGETYMVISDVSDMEEKLDKLVDSLCKFPRIRSFSKKVRVQKAKRSLGRPNVKPKLSAKQELLESSSSISLSSSEDEDQKKIQLVKKPQVKSKSPLKNSLPSDEGSSSISLNDSESEEEKKKKKKSSKAKAKANSDSSDDFVPVKKKKYDKLLRVPVFSDDDDDDSSRKESKKPKEKLQKKVTRKRKIASSSDEKEKKSSKSTGTSSDDDDDDAKEKKQTRKRRRIKNMGSSSEEDGDGKTQDKDTPAKGRKNIRKIVSQKKLEKTTLEAQAEEKERKRRIAERQKLYNKIEEKVKEGKETVIRKMVLEIDPDSKEEIVEINPDLVSKLKPHQVEGVKFMWECTIESVKDLKKPGSGCILAHCMGLGKTLQVITFLHTCLTNKVVGKVIKRAMVICPYNTALNWGMEFDYWLEDIEGDVKIHQLSTVKSNLERLDILKYWFEEGGVIIISYDLFRRLAANKIPKLRKKEKEAVTEYLLDPGPDIVVCDEGHVLKNEKSAVSVATNKLLTRRRIVLTGTPLQNNLKEYHCMLSFVKPNLLGTMLEFRNRFVNPIMNGQYDDSNAYDVKLMKKRIHILHKLLDGCVQRCDYSALTKFLPPKHEFVISVKLSEVQIKMYECYLDKIMSAKKDAKVAGMTLFADFNHLRNVWTHPYICHTAHQRMEMRRFLKEDNEDDEFINDDSVSEPDSSFSSGTPSEKELSSSKEDEKENGKKKYKTRSRVKNGVASEEEEEEEEAGSESKEWYNEFITEADKYNVELSGKIVLLLEILKECERIGDKILLFSQSLLSLDFIEEMLSFSHSQSSSQKKDEDKDIQGTWIKGLDYFRMDGTTSVDFRKNYIDMFNDPSNERSRLFLISTRAGSLGTNLVGANRVIIFDTSWNPSHDVQAIFRVYRFGQLKPVFIYRFLAQGTMEEKIYDRQVTKISLSYRVVDEQQIDRHFSAADLAELYSFDRNFTKQRPTPMVPKDRLLAELLIKYKEWIVTYHEHDSLLQNETETDLTEEERQAAWTEYENEKEGRANASFGTSNSFMQDFDATSLVNEPDFSHDYEGRKIPDLKTIVEFLFEHLKKNGPDVQKNPLEFKKRLLSSVYSIRQAFQEKHVKILRMKQEYCTRGTVPNAVNKYMDELTQILKSTADYITRLSSAIASETIKFQKMQQEQMYRNTQPAGQFNQSTGQFNQPTMFQVPMPNVGRGNPKVFMFNGPVGFGQMTPAQRAAAFNQYLKMTNLKPSGNFKAPANNTNSAQHSDAQDPVITEVDDSTPIVTDSTPSGNTSTIISAPSTSTVTIKEIT